MDIFSLYFFYWDFMKEAKKVVESDTRPPSLLTINLGFLKDHMSLSPAIKPFEKHILYKILLIINSKGKDRETAQEHKVFDPQLLEVFNAEKDKKVLVYSFITVGESD